MNPIYRMLAREKPGLTLAAGLMIAGVLMGLALGKQLEALALTPDHSIPHGRDVEITWWELTSHNIKVGLLFAFGALFASLPTLFFGILNGVWFGIAMVDAWDRMSIWAVFAGMIPHGVVEVPAIWLVTAAGLRPLFILFAYMKGKTIVWLEEGKQFFSLIVCSCLLFSFSGFIEVYVTPRIMEWF
ncbi:stage II sporulation protein M [Desmospora profundinema]|uniref:Stage II sporulation protein M n=1 Tax=Desmospora profundinema TaxID=1571184 RepID=A0ABU1ISV1_9BACL|nr:stage II sporulation protein M [Desmospora profundinema]MDR6227009.1 stage II sporulation protein M [Desmospora profundinema]